jgi:hypothetical protein
VSSDSSPDVEKEFVLQSPLLLLLGALLSALLTRFPVPGELLKDMLASLVTGSTPKISRRVSNFLETKSRIDMLAFSLPP